MKWFLVLVAVAACGKVSSNKPDAPVQRDAPAQIDAPADGSTQTLTAIGADNISQLTLPSAVFTKVPYGSVIYDDGAEFDAATSTFTPKYAGDYLICASVFPTTNHSIPIEIDLFKNGVRERAFGFGYGIATGCRATRLAAGDAVDVRAYQASGGNVTSNPDMNWNWLAIERLTATAMIENTANVSVPNGVATLIPYANVVFDTSSAFDAATSQYAAPTAGDYLVCASKDIASTTVPAELNTWLNGARESSFGFSAGGAETGCRSTRMAVNDKLEIRTFQASGGTVSMTGDQVWDWFTIQPLPTSVSETAITAFTANAATFTKVPYTTEAFDANGEFDVSTSTFTAATPGDYLVCMSLLTRTTGGGDELDLYKNGVREKGIDFGSDAVTGCRIVRLALHDQLQVYYYNNGTVSLTEAGLWDWLEVSKLK